MHERGIDISHETIRFWLNGFGPVIVAEIEKAALLLSSRAHLTRPARRDMPEPGGGQVKGAAVKPER